MNAPQTPEQLEQALDRLAREQPQRRAPAALADAVLARIEQRAARPWWRRDFTQWPAVARVVFLLGACVPAVFVCLAFGRLDGQVVSMSSQVETSPPFTAVQALGMAFDLVVRGLSGEWFWGAVTLLVIVYAAVFGLSVAGYRVLYARR